MRYGIVGFGTAGYHGVKNIRKFDKSGIIDVYSNTGLAPYNPMLTTYYAAGKLPYEGMFPFGALEQMQKELEFTCRAETVKRVDAKKLCIETEQGKETYDKILIASGARAVGPDIQGLAKEDCFLMRTAEDGKRLRERIDTGKAGYAIVIGASMVGIKVAELLNQQGIRTCLVDLAEQIFPLAAYPDVAKEIERRVERQGVTLHFGATVDRMEQREGCQMAVLTDGTSVLADLVVMCIGTRPNTDLAADQVKVNRGIIVNEKMETSVPGVYAAGDCCEGNNLESGQTQIIGLWANANHQGLTAGANMAGHSQEFQGNIPHNITHFMNMDFIGFGDNRIQGKILEHGSLQEGLFIRLVCKDGVIAGANILENFRISGMIKNYMLRLFSGDRREIPDYQRGMLVKAGISEEFIDKIAGEIYG